jgi:hypothetical protein
MKVLTIALDCAASVAIALQSRSSGMASGLGALGAMVEALPGESWTLAGRPIGLGAGLAPGCGTGLVGDGVLVGVD